MHKPVIYSLQSQFFGFIQIVALLSFLGIPLLAWFIPMPMTDWYKLAGVSLSSLLFLLFVFRVLIPRVGSSKWINILAIVSSIILIAHTAYLLHPYNVSVEILYFLVIAGIGIAGGHRISLWIAPVPTAVVLLFTFWHSHDTINIPALAIKILILLMTGYAISFLTGMIHDQLIHTAKQYRYLATLHQVGTIASSSEDLKNILSHISELITQDIPATSCCICLLSPQEDQIIIYGAYPIRPLVGWNICVDDHFNISGLPIVQEVLENGQCRVLRKDLPECAAAEQNAGLFIDGVRTVCLVPLKIKDKKLGVISIGEARSWEREPFNQEKIGFLQTLAAQIAPVIYNPQLFQEANQKAQRLAALNEVARAIGSTIELDQLLNLIYEQLNQVIPSDTYYVSLYNPQEETLDIRVLIDDGIRFPRQIIVLGDGFSSWVINNRSPLHVRHLSQEIDALPVKPVQLGLDRLSESWLGVPLIIGEQVLGLLAIASYEPYAFDEDDVVLLSSVAQQAALALDNARNHAAVKEQARRDSLTGVYNHGYLILRLEEEVEKCRHSGGMISLIMIDIDHFKLYNDQYGHLVGDEVLRRLAASMQAHAKKTDIAGRWGGEEFAIVLIGASTDQAYQVAQRIRKSLAELQLYDKHGTAIPSPTISQGIATFPLHARDAAELVDAADMLLYKAKEMGRDQVRTAD
ncbi:MAG: sensor domain-containing diguanylate cyclase [Anaerolineales bacterium]|nr:sensor domain-containing diguanylate cyclase [Anaerolineales bacterium]